MLFVLAFDRPPSFEGHCGVVKLLLDGGATVDLPQSSSGVTPLLTACGNGHTSVVRELLSRGADVRLTAKDGGFPLKLACQNGYLDVAMLLVAHGADVNQ